MIKSSCKNIVHYTYIHTGNLTIIIVLYYYYYYEPLKINSTTSCGYSNVTVFNLLGSTNTRKCR